MNLNRIITLNEIIPVLTPPLLFMTPMLSQENELVQFLDEGFLIDVFLVSGGGGY